MVNRRVSRVLVRVYVGFKGFLIPPSCLGLVDSLIKHLVSDLPQGFDR